MKYFATGTARIDVSIITLDMISLWLEDILMQVSPFQITQAMQANILWGMGHHGNSQYINSILSK